MFYWTLYFLIQSRRSYFTNTQITTQLILHNIVISFNLKLHNPNSVYHFCLLYQVSRLKRTLLFTVLQQMQKRKDNHRSDSTRLPRRDYMVHAYCLNAREETASLLIEHHAAVKMEYMLKQCVHLLWHFLLKPCADTADLCCLTSMCYWCFSINIVI